MKRAISVLFLLAVSGFASAQLVYPIDLVGQPMIRLEEGRIAACGLRIFGFYMVSPDNPAMIIDTSFSLDKSMFGFVKFTAGLGTIQEIKNQKQKSLRVVSGWFKAQGQPSTLPLNKKTSAGDDGNSLIYVTSLKSVADLLEAQIDGRTISIGIRRQGDSGDRIFSGIVSLTKEEQTQMADCFKEFMETVRAK